MSGKTSKKERERKRKKERLDKGRREGEREGGREKGKTDTHQALDEVPLSLGLEASHVVGAEAGVGGPIALGNGVQEGLSERDDLREGGREGGRSREDERKEGKREGRRADITILPIDDGVQSPSHLFCLK